MQEAAQDLVRQTKQEQGEPVAYMYPDDLERMQTSDSFCTVFSVKVGSPDKGLSTVELYTTPHQRTWVGLTNEEILKFQDIVPNTLGYDLIQFAKAIEAKLKAKNGP